MGYNNNRNTQNYNSYNNKKSFGKWLLSSVIIGWLSYIVRYFIK